MRVNPISYSQNSSKNKVNFGSIPPLFGIPDSALKQMEAATQTRETLSQKVANAIKTLFSKKDHYPHLPPLFDITNAQLEQMLEATAKEDPVSKKPFLKRLIEAIRTKRLENLRYKHHGGSIPLF